jgi:hypothetical protein
LVVWGVIGSALLIFGVLIFSLIIRRNG